MPGLQISSVQHVFARREPIDRAALIAKVVSSLADDYHRRSGFLSGGHDRRQGLQPNPTMSFVGGLWLRLGNLHEPVAPFFGVRSGPYQYESLNDIGQGRSLPDEKDARTLSVSLQGSRRSAEASS
jgi:hypothetical protein